MLPSVDVDHVGLSFPTAFLGLEVFVTEDVPNAMEDADRLERYAQTFEEMVAKDTPA